MDEEFKTYFRLLEDHMVSMEGRLSARMDQLDARMDQLDARIDEVKAYVDQRCERVETSLLTEFQKWASPVEMRLRSHTVVLRTLDMDLEALADRVKRIESRESGQAH